MNTQKQIEEMAKFLCKETNSPYSHLSCGHCVLNRGLCNYQKEAQILYNAGYRKQSDTVKEILELIPEKMFAETIRFDSAYGISKMLHISMEEAENIKQKYNKLQELKERYIEE